MCSSDLEYANIIYTVSDGIATIKLNRPKALNALNSEINADIMAAINEVKADPSVRVLIVTGSERAFAAGADVKEMAEATPRYAREFSGLAIEINNVLESMPIPTIAAVAGFAFGGGFEMPLACDFRIGGPRTSLAFPECGLGIIPGFGGTQRMARIIGTGPAMELIYTADTIDANRALEIGMVNHVVPADQLMDEAMKLAEKICKNAQKAIRASKLAIRRGMDCDISTAVSYEALAFATCFGTEDQKEGMQAFLEKRKEKHFKNA